MIHERMRKGVLIQGAQVRVWSEIVKDMKKMLHISLKRSTTLLFPTHQILRAADPGESEEALHHGHEMKPEGLVQEDVEHDVDRRVDHQEDVAGKKAKDVFISIR